MSARPKERKPRILSAEQRWAQKQAERQYDVDRLERGEISAEELNGQNGALAGAMKGARISFARPGSLA